MLKHPFDLSGKVAVVTGGNRGLGQGIATALARAGADIVSIQTGEDAPVTRKTVTSFGRCFSGYACDLSRLENAKPLVEQIENECGPVDILVNNAGVQRRHKAEEFPLSDWDFVLQVQLRSVFLTCQAFGERMLMHGHGKIINLASLLSFSGGITVPAYAAAKGGVAQLTKALANEWASRGINVNAIAPGYMDTDMNTALIADPIRNEQIMARIPAHRWGKPEDIGGPAVFLASSASDYVHGQILCVDGGWMAR